jgi:hypothetical protein
LHLGNIKPETLALEWQFFDENDESELLSIGSLSKKNKKRQALVLKMGGCDETREMG